MAYGEDRFFSLMEVAHHGLDTLVSADIFRAAAACAVDRIIFLDVHLGERLVDFGQMAKSLDIGLMSFEIVQRGLDHFTRFLVRADHMDGMAYGLHSLLEHIDFIFFGEFTAEHQNFLASHLVLLLAFITTGWWS